MKYSVKKQSRQGVTLWGVYFGSKLVEGGFFNRDAAEDCAQTRAGQTDTKQRDTQ
jgi:hypothetical protein